MAKPFRRRFDKANTVAAGAYQTFNKAAEELELAARLHKENYDELQAQIDELTNLAGDSQRNGMRAERNAKKLREFFL